jgi:hypothetical protein
MVLLYFDFITKHYYKNPEVFIFLILFAAAIGLIIYSNAHKVSTKAGEIHSSKSKPANSRKEIVFYFGLILIVIALFILTGWIPVYTKRPVPTLPTNQERVVNIQREIGGYGNLPILRIKRNCFKRASHEYENYSLFAGNFKNKIDAMNRVSTLDAYNIRGVETYEKLCDTIPMIAGEYFVFLGRRCTSLSSIQRYEKKYETMFRTNDTIDLKIVKWEKETAIYTYY